MSEQPEPGTPEAPDDTAGEATVRRAQPEHEHVRTAGETAVDDAIGGADDPR
jgi:hypothetical protein